MTTVIRLDPNTGIVTPSQRTVVMIAGLGRDRYVKIDGRRVEFGAFDFADGDVVEIAGCPQIRPETTDESCSIEITFFESRDVFQYPRLQTVFAISDLTHDKPRTGVEFQLESRRVLLEIELQRLLCEFCAQVATLVGNLDSILLLVLPCGLDQDGAFRQSPFAQPRPETPLLRPGTNDPDIDACHSDRLAPVDGQLHDRGTGLRLNDARRYDWRVVAERSECCAGIRDGLLDYLVTVARPEPGPRAELHRIDVAQYVLGQCVVETVYHVPDVAEYRNRNRKQRQAQDSSGFQQSVTAFGTYESRVLF